MKKATLIGRTLLATIMLTCSAAAYAAIDARPDSPREPASASAPSTDRGMSGDVETGLAAVYSDRLHGRKTASGERYDRNALTAAHKTLPFGTRVKVTHQKNRKSATLRINDRGPTQAGRILDISPRAAKALGMRPTAMAEVTAEVVGQAPRKKK
jgi:rare lipoprotein A